MGHTELRYHSDISCTVFLNSANEYEGDELQIKTQHSSRNVKKAME